GDTPSLGPGQAKGWASMGHRPWACHDTSMGYVIEWVFGLKDQGRVPGFPETCAGPLLCVVAGVVLVAVHMWPMNGHVLVGRGACLLAHNYPWAMNQYVMLGQALCLFKAQAWHKWAATRRTARAFTKGHEHNIGEQFGMAQKRNARIERIERCLSIEGEYEIEGPSIMSMLEHVIGQINDLKQQVESNASHVSGNVSNDSIDKMAEEINVLKKGVGQDKEKSPFHVKTPHPKYNDGKRDAKALENFLWDVDNYLKATETAKESQKVDVAAMFLSDDAKLWWRSRCESDRAAGLPPIETWEGVKGELRRQFLPDNTSWVARENLRNLKHVMTIRDYVKEFMSLLLDIKGMFEEEKLFQFVTGLKPWAQVKLRRQKVVDLNGAIVAAEVLVDLRYEGNNRGKDKADKKDKCKWEGDDDKSSTKKLNFQKSEKKWESGCFICKGPHLARNCLKKERLSVIIMEEGDHDTSKDDDLSPRMGSNKLLVGDHTPQIIMGWFCGVIAMEDVSHHRLVVGLEQGMRWVRHHGRRYSLNVLVVADCTKVLLGLLSNGWVHLGQYFGKNNARGVGNKGTGMHWLCAALLVGRPLGMLLFGRLESLWRRTLGYIYGLGGHTLSLSGPGQAKGWASMGHRPWACHDTSMGYVIAWMCGLKDQGRVPGFPETCAGLLLCVVAGVVLVAVHMWPMNGHVLVGRGACLLAHNYPWDMNQYVMLGQALCLFKAQARHKWAATRRTARAFTKGHEHGIGDDDKSSTKKLNFQKLEKKWDSGCFICKGPHLARNCLKKERLSAIIMEEGDHDTSKDDDLSPRMGSMKLLDGDHTPQIIMGWFCGVIAMEDVSHHRLMVGLEQGMRWVRRHGRRCSLNVLVVADCTKVLLWVAIQWLGASRAVFWEERRTWRWQQGYRFGPLFCRQSVAEFNFLWKASVVCHGDIPLLVGGRRSHSAFGRCPMVDIALGRCPMVGIALGR
ncbi:MAGUK p55 subfamily member 7, partial [Bienertia sinuspersici]